jgi:hypothetical protein
MKTINLETQKKITDALKPMQVQLQQLIDNMAKQA